MSAAHTDDYKYINITLIKHHASSSFTKPFMGMNKMAVFVNLKSILNDYNAVETDHCDVFTPQNLLIHYKQNLEWSIPASHTSYTLYIIILFTLFIIVIVFCK